MSWCIGYMYPRILPYTVIMMASHFFSLLVAVDASLPWSDALHP
jgi:hypothetical protein